MRLGHAIPNQAGRPVAGLPAAQYPTRPEEEEDDSDEDEEAPASGWHICDPEHCDWPGSEPCGRNHLPIVAGVLGVLVLASVLALFCLDAVPPLHWGIKYNSFSKSADISQVWAPGRHFVGPFSKFILFPARIQSVEFRYPSSLMNMPNMDGRVLRFEPLHTRTKDGLGLNLSVSLQYILRWKVLGRLYSKYNTGYEDIFVSTVRGILIKAASEFSAPQLWKQRELFGNQMQAMVNQSLWDLDAECWGLQLLLLDLPDVNEETLTRTQVQTQQMSTNEMLKAIAQTHAETGVIQSDYALREKVILASGHANFTVTTKQAHAKAQQQRIDTEASVMRSIGLQLTMIGEDLVAYQRYNAMDDLEESRLFYGFGGAAPMLVSAAS